MLDFFKDNKDKETLGSLLEIVYYIREQEAQRRKEYEEFLKTDEGKKWVESWNGRIPDNECVGFGEYLYDFYPEMLQ